MTCNVTKAGHHFKEFQGILQNLLGQQLLVNCRWQFMSFSLPAVVIKSYHQRRWRSNNEVLIVVDNEMSFVSLGLALLVF